MKRPIFNVPEEGYVTPRLKAPEHTTEAVGFLHYFDELVDWPQKRD